MFVIDPNKKVRLILTYPPGAGRNFQEILRELDSLPLTDREKFSTPADWMPGDRVVISLALSDEATRAKYPQGFETQKPYLRLVQLEGTAR